MATNDPAVTGLTEPTESTDAAASDAGPGVLLGPDSDVDPTLSVVLPTLDEEEGIAECIDRIRSALRTLGIRGEVVVSDSSTDRTPEIAREEGAIVVEPDAPGYGYAYQYAFERCRGEYVAMGDADTTYDFEELPKLYRHVAEGDADIAVGSRLDGEIEPGAMPALHRYVGNPVLTAFLNRFYGTGVSDAHSGMRVLTREALDELDLRAPGMEFASEMIMAAGAADLTVAEEPITYHERVGEATLDSFRDGWRHVRFMLANAPGYLFTAPGVALSLFGLLVVGAGLAGVSVGPAGVGPHSMIAGCLALVLGVQAVTLGVFARLGADPVRSPSDPLTGLVTDALTLERSLALALLLVVAGGSYAVLMVGRWVASGFSHLPLLTFDVVAMTAILLGTLVAFNAFFLSVIADESRGA